MFYMSFLTISSTLNLLPITHVFMQMDPYTFKIKGSFVCYF